MSNYVLGALPSPKDPRDFIFPSMVSAVELPRKFMFGEIPTKDQGWIGACVAYGDSSGAETEFTYDHLKPYERLSEGWLYGLPNLNGGYRGVGSFPREVFEVMQKTGMLSYDEYPFIDEKPRIVDKVAQDIKDNPELLKKAEKRKIGRYYQLAFSSYSIKEAMFQTKAPVGFSMSIRGGYLYLTDVGEDKVHYLSSGSLIGYHWMIFIGWDDDKELLYVKNSWGNDFGNNGVFAIRYQDIVPDSGTREGFSEIWAFDSEPPKNILRMKIGSKEYSIEHGGNGEKKTYQMDVPCFLDKNDRTQVPIRFVANAFGIPDEDIVWSPYNYGIPKKYYPDRSYVLITDKKRGFRITFCMGKPEYTRNPLTGGDNRGFIMDTIPYLDEKAGRVFVPVRFLANALQGLVEWNEKSPDDITIRF